MSEPDGIFGGTGWRPTVINWEGQLQRLIDDYEPFATLDHAVQKDGIQNSWDGRTSRRRGAGWSATIELHEDSDGHTYLTITDEGTTGLTGRVLDADEYLTYLPEDERWARFESLAFTHDPEADTSDYLGARGQGKFIFVGGSKSRRILYDSRRGDGTYRVGARFVERTQSPVNSWDGPAGEAKLREFSRELSPLAVPGTRVIIDDPVDDIVVAMRSGRMVDNVADTWWSIIEKYGATINVAVQERGTRTEQLVSVPHDLVLARADAGGQKVWLRENAHLDIGGTRYTVKRAHFAYKPEGVRPEIQGIALLRGGMVVNRLPMPGVPSDVSAKVTGYVEFDSDLDIEMKRLESPNHYTFNLRRGAGLRVKHWIEDELRAFAAEKLGIGRDRGAAAERVRRDAEKRALEELNRRARALGLVGLRGRAGGGGGGGGGGRPRLPISVQLAEPVLPQVGTRRIEFDEGISNISLRVVNSTDAELKARVSLYLTRGDAVMASYLQPKDVVVPPDSASGWTKPASTTFSSDEFLAGPYVLRAKLLVLESPHRPRMWEERDGFKFWIAEDPPQGGLFDDVRPLSYPPDLVKIDAEAIPEANGWVFQYNVLHPAFLRLDGSDEELTEYLFELMVREMLYVDLTSTTPVLFDGEALADNRTQQRRASLLTSEIMFDFYQAA